MSYAGKANLVLSVVQGVMVAGITALLGSSVWWLWGLAWAAFAFVAIGCVQVGSE
jgi:hypothetical protein